ncbi:MAG: hypothetical protein AAFP77_18900 [Bacteroidota bacterium]
MPKTPSSRLFDLIKSLSGSEKRYFKVVNKMEANSKYRLLFEAIEAQEVFKDEALQRAVYGNEEIQSRKYSELKAYLYDLILRSLQQYDEQTSIDYQLKSLLQSVRSLYRRWLLNDCKHLLRRAKKIALQYEQFATILEVLDWEKKLAYANADIDYFDAHLQNLQEEEERCLQQMSNIKTYQGLFYRLYLMVRKNTVRSQGGREQVERIKQHPLLADEEQCLSFRATVLYYRAHTLLDYQLRDRLSFYSQCKTLVELMETKPHLLREDASEYISVLSNYATSCGYLRRYDETRIALQKLKSIKPKTIDDQLKIHRQYYNNYFSLCINTGKFEEGLRILKDHLKELKKLDKNLFERSTFFFQYFYIYFGVEDYDQALTYLNEWLSLPRSVEQQDLQHLARLLNLIIHFELGNTILLSSLLRSTQRSLQKSGRYNTFEQFFLACLRQASQAPGHRERKAVFENSLSKFSHLDLNPADRAILRFFNFACWLEAKAQNASFAEVVEQQAVGATS